MFSSSRSLSILCVIGYLVFMGLSLDSSMVDALVFYIVDVDGNPIMATGNIVANPIYNRKPRPLAGPPIVALQFKERTATGSTVELNCLVRPRESASKALADGPAAAVDLSRQLEPVRKAAQHLAERADIAEKAVKTGVAESAAQTAAKEGKTGSNPKNSQDSQDQGKKIAKGLSDAPETTTGGNARHGGRSSNGPPTMEEGNSNKVAESPSDGRDKSVSVLSLIKKIGTMPWVYNPKLDRFVVNYDAETTIVLTIRPGLQRLLEEVFSKRKVKLGAGLIQDPRTGAILAMTSKTGQKLYKITDKEFLGKNWNTKATFPVASLFKIITAAAGLERKKITNNSQIKAWKKYYMPVWEAFARSHNGVFGRIAQRVGRSSLENFAAAFGFNKSFFFDLPVGNSVARLPVNAVKLGQAAAGLDRHFLVSPVHVASIVSTILNRGRTMKAYLVDYVLHRNKVVFRRKPFPLAQPISPATAQAIYRMMQGTTTQGTGKSGFAPREVCENLPHLSGGKTGTLTGENPHYLITWFGGFTKTAGRDLCIVTMCGQNGRSRTRGATLAGDLSYKLYLARTQGKLATPAHMARK